MKRKSLIAVLLSVLIAGIGLDPASAASRRGPLAGQNLYRDVEYYASLGDHRTATAGDKKTAVWLIKSLRQAGYETYAHAWPTHQFYPIETQITIEQTTPIQAFPVWWPKPTDSLGITGQLSQDIEDTAGRIYVFVNASAATYTITDEFVETIETAWFNGAIGVIVVTYYNGPKDTIGSDEFIGLNADQDNQEQWPIPVVSIMARDHARIQDALVNGSEIKLVSTGRYNYDAVAHNVVATLDRGPGSPRVVVSTPYSGWFTCAGERGTGVAIFLGLARWAARNTQNTTWVFTATSGHELNALGIMNYLQEEPGSKDILCWVHIGAWQAMYNYILQDGVMEPTTELDLRYMQYQGNSLVTSAVSNNFSDPSLNIGLIPTIRFGDLLEVLQYGYSNVWGISISHEYHHSTQDLPLVTGPEILEPTARAYQRALAEIIGE